MSDLPGGERPMPTEAIPGQSGLGTMTESRPLGTEFQPQPEMPEHDKKVGIIQRLKNFRGTKEILDIADDVEGTIRHESGDISEAIQSKSKAAYEKTSALIRSERTRKIAKFAIPAATAGIMMKRRASHKEPSIMDQPKDMYNRFKRGVNSIDTIRLHNPIEIKRS